VNAFALSRHTVVRLATAVLLGAFFLSTGLASADGPGEVRAADVTIGGYRLTVATSPSPLEVGDALVSVLVQDERRSPVLDVTVEVQAAPADTPLGPSVAARTGAVANRLLYAAPLRLDRPGRWQLVVRVEGKDGAGELPLVVEVQPAGPLNIMGPIALLALPSLVVIAGFLARQARLKRQQSRNVVPS
jgi:hypothetical protein